LKDTTKAWKAGLRAEIAKYEPVKEAVVVVEKPKHGQCFKCGHGSFSLRIDKRTIYRTCKNEECGAEQPPIE